MQPCRRCALVGPAGRFGPTFRASGQHRQIVALPLLIIEVLELHLPHLGVTELVAELGQVLRYSGNGYDELWKGNFSR